VVFANDSNGVLGVFESILKNKKGGSLSSKRDDSKRIEGVYLDIVQLDEEFSIIEVVNTKLARVRRQSLELSKTGLIQFYTGRDERQQIRSTKSNDGRLAGSFFWSC